MEKRVKKRSPSSVMIAIVALIVAVSSTVAWFVMDQGEVTGAYKFKISSFAVPTVEMYFWHNETEYDAASYQNITDGTVNVDFVNSTSINYIGKLRVNISYTGYGEAFLRVKMTHQFVKEGVTGGDDLSLQYNAELPYTISTPYLNTDVGNCRKWYDNRKNDYCFYLASAVYTSSNSTSAEIPFITGFDDTQFDEAAFSGASLKIAIEVEAVQFNRYPQFWGMTELPWPGASSSTSINLVTTSP